MPTENKKIYREFCDHEKSIPLFSKSYWLDEVAGKHNWDVALVINKNKEIIASMPYLITKKFGLNLSLMPKLTQTIGPWLKPFNGAYSKKLAYEKDCLESLIMQLPTFHYFYQSWNYDYENWLPFYWSGYKQTTRYTYVIDNLSNLDAVYTNFQSKIKGDIKKSKNRFNLIIRDDLPIDSFIKLNNLVFERQGMKTPYSSDFVKSIDRTCVAHNCRKLLIATDHEGTPHAGVYIVWDKTSAYYLMGGSDPELRNSGATSLCLWEAIQFSSTVTERFDFEGSMLEPVERFVRGFGATQKPYHSISKASSAYIELLIHLYKKYRSR